jgi:threonine/homoserine/homoserine lactone efflux protein
MSLYGLLSFCVAYVLAVASPGPGVAAVLARSLGHGMRGAPAFIAGFLVGDLVWFALAAAGLAALAQVARPRFSSSGTPACCTCSTWRIDYGPHRPNR